MKARRHSKILELINGHQIDTQEELLRRLRADGFDVTQATVSRDIKELRLVKTLSSDGKYRYATSKEPARDAPSKFYSLFSDSAVGVDYAGNIVVIKCLTGMGQGVCAALDSIHWENVVGTIAGDDTILALCRTEEQAAKMAAELKKFIVGR